MPGRGPRGAAHRGCAVGIVLLTVAHGGRRGHAGPVATTTTRPARVAGTLAVGAAVAVALGVYGRVHQPTFRPVTTLGFPDLVSMKVWLGSVAGLLALVQLGSALRLFGHLGSGPAPSWLGTFHRVAGGLAVLVSLPVAYHCLWALGFQYDRPRVLVHSLAGCIFYGAFVAKVMTLHSRMPRWALPVLGGLTFTALVVVVLTSAVWFLTTVGLPGGATY